MLGERAAARDLFDPEVVRQIVARHQGGENHSERLWSLINLEVWQRIFLDGEDHQHIVRERQSAMATRDLAARRALARAEMS